MVLDFEISSLDHTKRAVLSFLDRLVDMELSSDMGYVPFSFVAKYPCGNRRDLFEMVSDYSVSLLSLIPPN